MLHSAAATVLCGLRVERKTLAVMSTNSRNRCGDVVDCDAVKTVDVD